MIVSYQWLQEYLGDESLTPEKISELLTFHSFEIEGDGVVGDDVAIDVKVLPNRGSDSLCHRGVAREISSISGKSLAFDPLASVPKLTDTTEIKVSLVDIKACPRFTASIIKGVKVGESPAWLKTRLATLGQRSINNIVDATNYVMYAIGQPLHAYDADLFPQVDGVWQFGVRFGLPGEKVSLLAEGGKKEERVVVCQGTELLIVDESSNTPIGLAGVKGGSFAGVHAGTKNIIIEAAHFDPIVTRKTARRLGIVIDASKRFENRPSPELPLYAQRDIIDLISKIAGGTAVGVLDVYPEPQAQVEVELHPEQVNNLLGLTLSAEEMISILVRVGVVVEKKDDVLVCQSPFERTDLNIPEDYIEEICRLYGFDHIKSVVPETVPLLGYNARHFYSEKIRQVLNENGFSEVITSSFRKKDEVQLLNAIASDKSYLRSTLLNNLSETLDRNAGLTDLLGTSDTRVFEIGNTFSKSNKGIVEKVMVAIGVRLKPSGYSGKEDKITKEIIAVLESVLDIKLTIESTKGVTEFDLSALLNSLPVPTDYEAVIATKEISYQPFSLFPTISRDVAFWVLPAVTNENVVQLLNQEAGQLRIRTTFMDQFEKAGRTSLAFRLVFQASDRTLTDAELEGPMSNVYKAIEKAGWEAR